MKNLHFHKYLPWSEVINTHTDFHKYQFRVCEICNKVQSRKIWLMNSICAVVINQSLEKVKNLVK